MLSKRSQIQNTHSMIPFMCNVQIWKIYRDKKQINGYLELRGLDGPKSTGFLWGMMKCSKICCRVTQFYDYTNYIL